MLEMSSQKQDIVVSREEIQKIVERCAQAVKKHLKDKKGQFMMICVLKGAVFFFRDVLEHFNEVEYEIDFCKLSSYSGGGSTGRIDMELPCQSDLENKHIIVFEDIVDTGLSIDFLRNYFASKKVASLMICALLDKPGMRKNNVKVDFIGTKVPNAFLVGYGLDYDQKYRLLKDICDLHHE